MAGIRLALAYLIAHTLLSALAIRHVHIPVWVFAANLMTAAAFVYILRRGRGVGFKSEPVRWGLLWLPILTFWICYGWSEWTLHAFHPPGDTWDAAFIAIEQQIGQPTLWMAKGRSPILTEIASIFYASYYLYMLTLGVALTRRKEYKAFEEAVFAVSFGYAASYIVFALAPLLGPRWAFVDAGLLDISEQQLKGGFVTDLLNQIQYGGVALKGGAMPSSHTSTGVVFAVWCGRIWGWKAGAAAWVVVAGMCFGAAYARYHYALDIAAGAALGMASLRLAQKAVARKAVE